jgi:hypothetical protein
VRINSNLINENDMKEEITTKYFNLGLSEAISNVQESLKNVYENAISTSTGKSERMRNVLMGCAMANENNVCAKDIN